MRQPPAWTPLSAPERCALLSRKGETRHAPLASVCAVCLMRMKRST